MNDDNLNLCLEKQAIEACILEHFGLAGVRKQSYTIQRIASTYFTPVESEKINK